MVMLPSATDSYSPDFVAIKNRAERTPLRFTARNTLPYNSEFRMFELATALSRAHDTSPGPDGITYNMLRHLNTTSLSRLLFLFNRIWTEQKYTSQWHEATVIPILKPGKDPSNPLHYMPIALTSCLCKTFERMVNARLVFESEKQGCISPLQSGFRRDLVQGSNMDLIERQLPNAVNKLVAWCNNNGHAISPEKSRCVHFCRKRSIHLDPVIHINNVAIPVVDDIRFLEVIFDRKLTFLPHILHLRKKCERSLNILKVLSRTSWGADRTSLLRIYQAVILSSIDYGCMVYGSVRPTVLRHLDTIHHSALRISSGAFRTSPVESLYVICHQIPLHLRRQKISALYFFRAQSVPRHPISQLTLPAFLHRLYATRSSHILPFL
ncbi:hypothetical protein AVEN_54767-1 [Araneus ventricosus]|uniref:Reverse transcriptase domain-containing protein n=1 Tax=Araneus ventricosus TaxID=182803 RepID=A0A4Y2IZM2_ARAVE|nr:hypothetical protein AVEN_54767-1 [Araneus ventricosus]